VIGWHVIEQVIEHLIDTSGLRRIIKLVGVIISVCAGVFYNAKA